MTKRSFVASLTKVRREIGRGVGMVGVYERRDPVLSDPRTAAGHSTGQLCK